MAADAASVAAQLGLDDSYRPWLAALEAAGPVDRTAPLLPADPAGLLARLGVTGDDARQVLATAAGLERSPALQWLARRCRQLIVAGLGDPSAPLPPKLPELPAALGAAGRCFPVHLFLATVGDTLAWQQRRGLPENICWDAFTDLARHMRIYRGVRGVTGVDEPWWLTLHLRGLLYEFGRLQFNLLQIGPGSVACWYDDETAARLGTGFRPGDDALGVHIPESGPLTPGACADSVAAAGEFFARYFPSPTRRLAICESWLLDEQLAAYLPASANILAFQRLFTLVPGSLRGDRSVAMFVFRRSVAEFGSVPQRTTLQRAAVSHLRTGGHWRVRAGWIAL